MKLLPDSLFARHALFIVLLLLLGQALGVVLLHRLVYLPRVEHLAGVVARQVQALRQGLETLPLEQRAPFVERLNQGALAALPATYGVDEVDRLAMLDRGFIRELTSRVTDLGVDTVWRQGNTDHLSLRLRIEGVDYWVVLPDVVPGRAFSGALIAMLLGSTLLAFGAALWLQRWLNHPLERLVQATRTLAAEAQPEPLPEDGPREIATLSRSFNRLVSSLQEADRERTLMLAGVSHDLRTPLTVMRLGVEILRSSPVEPALLGSMARRIDEMDGIVGQFLDFARPDTLEMASAHSLDELARQLADAFEVHQRPLSLQLGGTPPLKMHAQAMRRVMSNLVENAWKYGRPPVVLATGRGVDGVWFEVRDHGDGVPEVEMAALRRPFVRGQASRSGAAGAGLGLAIADRIVRQHGGMLEMQNAQDGGLRVRALFPVQDAADLLGEGLGAPRG
jgi:two-component system osmolarity sensor histidine kinase EnvZ